MTTLAGRIVLKRSPLFRGLSDDEFDRVVALSAQRTYRNEEVVFSQGERGDSLYAIVTGRIRISTGTADGKERFLNIMEAGETFGEIALLDGGPRTGTATAIAPSELVSIRREPLFALLEREPRLALELLRLCGERLRWTSAQVEDAFLDAPARLAKRLLTLSGQRGERGRDGVTLQISQEDLAAFLGLSRQIVNQHLQSWKSKGWVDLGRGAVTLRNAGALVEASRPK
jgi:CRP/FNR family cyclic AMP-dependent transcriptional regulator